MNERFGTITILNPTTERYHNYIVYDCVCDCGEKLKATRGRLKSDSCCKECRTKRIVKSVTKHGMVSANSRLHRICYNAKKRCEDSSSKNFKDYGGRGIKFKFDSIEHMFNWSLDNGYSDNLTIDRIDNNGNYEPSNCRWVDAIVQANNKRDSQELNGVIGLDNIAKYLGISYRRLTNMVYRDKFTLNEIYEKSKTEPLFYASDSERRSAMQRKQSCHWRISKEDALLIVENIKNGSSINRESKRVGVDFKTIKTAIKRLEDGIYDL